MFTLWETLRTRLCQQRDQAAVRVLRLWRRLINRLFRIRRLQRIFGYLGHHLQDLIASQAFRQRLLNSRLTRPGAADHLEQIAAQLVTLRNGLTESRRREEDLNNRLQAAQSTGAMQAALQEMVNTQKAILEASKKPDKKLTLVDNRGLAKPSNFDGNSDFLQWKIRLESFVESVHGDFGQAMAWAEDETDPISNASMKAEFGETTPEQETIPDLESKDAQLYAVLQTLCEKEAFTLVRSAGKGKGLEAWRRLCKRFDPSTGGRRRALLRSVLNPNRCNKVEELSAAVENWEDQVRQYENRRFG